jgi:hypothetical protein
MDRLLDHLIGQLVEEDEKAAKSAIESFEEEKKKLKKLLGIK